LTTGSTDFGGGPISATFDYSAFVFVLDGAGNFVWNDSFHSGHASSVIALAMNAAGRVATVETYHNGSGVYDSRGNTLRAYSAAGALAWSSSFDASPGSLQLLNPSGLGVDASGATYLRDEISSGTLDFGAGPMTRPVLKYDVSGSLLWAKDLPPSVVALPSS
jgi:hypothetical protein